MKEETFDDMETTAMVNPEKDRNNRDCALVIFHNVAPDGYYFDAGSVYIKAENHTSRDNGEKTIFLYISEGAKLINIRHRNDGILSLRYEFANGPLQARHTYHVFLGTVVPANANAKQYLRFKITPVTATLEVEEQPGQYIPWGIDPSTGKVSKLLPLGDYAYRVRARQYHPTAGKAELIDATKPHDEAVNLHPAFGLLDIEPIDGMSVFIDGESVADYKRVRLDSGPHNVQISRPKYKLFTTTVTIADGETTHLTPDFEANFSTVSLLAPAPDVTIALREASTDRPLGKGLWNGELETGSYTVITSAPGHRESVHSIEVPAGVKNLTFNLPAPTPLYGSININSTPDGALIRLDGEERGETPAMLSNVLAGQHKLYLSAPGKASHSSTIDVRENEVSEVNVAMENGESVPETPLPQKDTTPRVAEKLHPVNSFDELPDFIVLPLGYDGVWDLYDKEKTQNALLEYFLNQEKTFYVEGNWVMDRSAHTQTIGNYDFDFYSIDYKSDENQISLRYIIKSDKYKAMCDYLEDLSHNPAEIYFSGSWEIIENVVENVDLAITKDAQYTAITVTYNFPANVVTVTGSVFDKKTKKPCIGAYVKPESGQGAVTDSEGRYRLRIAVPQKVKISTFGKKAKTIKVTREGTFNVEL